MLAFKCKVLSSFTENYFISNALSGLQVTVQKKKKKNTNTNKIKYKKAIIVCNFWNDLKN